MTAAGPGGQAPVAVPDSGSGPVPVPGRPDALAPGLWRVTAPNPGMMTGPGTNTYLVGGSELAVVDPGPANADHLEAMLAAAQAAGGRIRWVLVTHTHPDHAPGAVALAQRTGAELVGYEARDGFVPDTEAGDGWILDQSDVRLRAVYTPGHAGNHLCWMLDDHGLLLTGDHVMHGSTVVIKPPDGDMGAYLGSLQRLLDMGTRLVSIAPGHGRVIADPHATVEGIVAHRLDRERVVAEALAGAGPSTVGELVARVYADVRPELFAMARFSLWAHLRKLAADGAVTATTVGRPDVVAASTPAVPAPAPAATANTEPAVAAAAAADHPELHWVWQTA